MPSKSKKQAKLMRAVAHGWKPSRIKGPTRAVAKEFVDADKRRDKVTGYQFGGMASLGPAYGAARGMMDQYRGVPPQRGGIRPGPTGMMGGQGLAVPWQGPGPSPMSPGYRQYGALRQAMQRRGGPGGGGFGRFPGGSGPFVPPGGGRSPVTGGPGLPPGVDPRAVAADPEGWRRHRADPRFAQTQGPESLRGRRPGRGGMMGTLGGPGYGPDPLGSAGPGGSLRSNWQDKYRAERGLPTKPMPGPSGPYNPGGPGGRMQAAQNRFGALTQGAPGGGTIGRRPTPTIPGRRTAPPPGKFPGGGGPNIRGRNPMMRGAQRYGGRRGMMR